MIIFLLTIIAEKCTKKIKMKKYNFNITLPDETTIEVVFDNSEYHIKTFCWKMYILVYIHFINIYHIKWRKTTKETKFKIEKKKRSISCCWKLNAVFVVLKKLNSWKNKNLKNYYVAYANKDLQKGKYDNNTERQCI